MKLKQELNPMRLCTITLTVMSETTSCPDPCSVQLREITGPTAYLEHNTICYENAFYNACPSNIKEKVNAFRAVKVDLPGILHPHQSSTNEVFTRV